MKAQIKLGVDYNFIKAQAIKENQKTIEVIDENGKSFKEFKKEFYKNIEKMFAPVFYQAKTKNEKKFENSKIEYEIKEDESNFRIEEGEIKSELKITYPTYMNLIMDIIEKEGKKKPIIRRRTYEFEDISEEKISEIIDEMLSEYTNRISLNNMLNKKE